MDYVWTFLAPFAKDKAVWLTVASWVLAFANKKLGLGMNDQLVTDVAKFVSGYTAVHLSHVKIFGGDGKAPTDAEVSDAEKS